MPPLEAGEMIARYSDASHLLGSAKQEDLTSVMTPPQDLPGVAASFSSFSADEGGTGSRVELPTAETTLDRYFVATCEWRANSGTEFHLQKGDVVKITHMVAGGKYQRTDRGVSGLTKLIRLLAWAHID